jgi:murein L,D-transpeptidase YafK
MVFTPVRFAVFGVAALLLAGCNGEQARYPARAYAPVPPSTLRIMAEKGTDRNAPVLIRAYKKESEIEIWKQNRAGDYVLVKTYPVCRWSGQLGPKKKEGDRQVPEGFYTVTASQMNPNSSYWLSFNVGYPNPMERAMGRSGGDIMVHGTCSSRGCFAMTDAQIEEIYAVMRDAFAGGQKAVQFQSYPFRMTAENLASFRHDPNIVFWKNLKEGSDHFEVTKREPSINYCGQKYVFNAASASGRFDPVATCPAYTVEPSVAEAVQHKQKADETQIASLIERGTAAIRLDYADGSQHASFRPAEMTHTGVDGSVIVMSRPERRASLGDVSRPEAIGAVREVRLDERGQPKIAAPVVVAAVPAKPDDLKTVDAKPAETRPVETKPAEGTSTQPRGGLFGTSLAGLSGLFGPSPTQPVAQAQTADVGEPLYKRLIAFIPAEEAPAVQPVAAPGTPLPPRRLVASR